MTTPSAKFWDNIALRYSQQAIPDIPNYERKLAATQALMLPDMRIIEFGCGTGSTALAHAPYVAHVTATDVSASMVAIGREKAQAAGVTNVSFQQCGVEDFDGPYGCYDMVLALNLIHLLPDAANALKTFYRLLKPGGVFVSSTVCLADRLWYLRPVIHVMQRLGKAPHVSFLRAAAVLQETSDTGFHVDDHWTHGRANSLFLVARKDAAH
jgi:ubiquinone/menaquinone biosynthesis C-methylase UbiE